MTEARHRRARDLQRALSAHRGAARRCARGSRAPLRGNPVRAYLVLPFEQRQKTRHRAHLSTGVEIGIQLARGTVLRGGDRLRAADGTVIEVVAAPERVSTVRSRELAGARARGLSPRQSPRRARGRRRLGALPHGSRARRDGRAARPAGRARSRAVRARSRRVRRARALARAARIPQRDARTCRACAGARRTRTRRGTRAASRSTSTAPRTGSRAAASLAMSAARSASGS